MTGDSFDNVFYDCHFMMQIVGVILV